MLLRWYNGGGGLKVTISCLPPLKSSIYSIPVYYITKMVAFKLNMLKHLGKTHRPQTFPLEEIGQQLQGFFLRVKRNHLIGSFIQSIDQLCWTTHQNEEVCIPKARRIQYVTPVASTL